MRLGLSVGSFVGLDEVGEIVGPEGAVLGTREGRSVGSIVGMVEGTTVGSFVGLVEGQTVGIIVGLAVGS